MHAPTHTWHTHACNVKVCYLLQCLSQTTNIDMAGIDAVLPGEDLSGRIEYPHQFQL